MKLVPVLATVLLLVVGCPSPSMPTKTIELSMDEVTSQRSITRDVTLSVRQTLKLSLGSNHSTPYRWTPDPKIGDAALLKQTSHEYFRGDSGRVGGPGSEVWMFTAEKAGKTTIVAIYASVSGDPTVPKWTFTANVTVQ